MESELIDIKGKEIRDDQLQIKRAKDFCIAVQASRFSSLLAVYSDEVGQEIVCFSVEIEVPQYPVVPIQRIEHIGVCFDPSDKTMPQVLMLRDSFPKLPHRILGYEEKPVSLCLYDVPFEEVKIFWTGTIYLERIREWLKLVAIGKLHQDDQPLEPLLLVDNGMIYFSDLNPRLTYYIYRLKDAMKGKLMLLASTIDIGVQLPSYPAKLEYLRGEPQVHGLVDATPRNLNQLHEFLSKAGLDIKKFIVNKIKEYKEKKEDLSKGILLLIELSKKRIPGGDVESVDFFCFLTAPVEDLGKELGLWAPQPGTNTLGCLLGPVDEGKFKNLWIDMFTPVFEFDRKLARRLSGVREDFPDISVFAIGSGALGSQIESNLGRSGIGYWRIMDDDIFLPHNLSKHLLNGGAILSNKSDKVSEFINSIISGIAESIVGNIIKDINEPHVQKALDKSDFILDISASSAALKFIANQPIHRRICSCSLNPAGSDLVVYAEDSQRQYEITSLEMQYLRFILHETKLHNHFKFSSGSIRYGGGCRDVSSVIPQDSVAFAAALASKAIKNVMTSNDPFMRIWKTNQESLECEMFSPILYKSMELKSNDWRIQYDEYVSQEIERLRKYRLPNETGGILIGSYDMERKIIFVTDIIPSPPDSKEYPIAYIRGIEGVEQMLRTITDITAGVFQYVGEWHSHPDGVSTNKSSLDNILFKWLCQHMNREGHPALMAIAGEKNQISFYAQ